MRVFHTADLHLGKRVNNFSMLEDQRYILKRMIEYVDEYKPDVFLISGDIYDVTAPSEGAVSLFDDFLENLARRDVKTLVVSGNHDSGTKLQFGNRLMGKSGVYIKGNWDGKLSKRSFTKDNVEVDFWLLPFVRPTDIRRFLDTDQTIATYHDAVTYALSTCSDTFNPHRVNILLAHQFVTSGQTKPNQSDSERITVGTLDNVDVSAFDMFDYVALGHIHGPQKMKRETVRYAGSPLKYSFSEINHNKSITMLDISEDKLIDITLLELKPKYDLREVRGTFDEVVAYAHSHPKEAQDYVYVVLTNDEESYSYFETIKIMFPRLMIFSYDNSRTQAQTSMIQNPGTVSKDNLSLFEEFYEAQNGIELNEKQREIVTDVLNSLMQGEV